MASALSLTQGDAPPETIETGAAVFGITSCWTGDWNGDGRRDIAVAEPWRSDALEFRKPLAIAPASTDYPDSFDDWGRAWSLAVEPTDGIEPPRLLLRTKSPYGGTHSGVLICSSTTGELLLRVVRPAPTITRPPSGQ